MNKKNFSKGIGLLELMLALAIISMLTVAAVRYFSVVSASSRVEQAMEMVSAIRAAGERWKVGNDDYTSASIGEFVARGFLPGVYSKITTPWGGVISAAKNTDPTKLDIKFTNVPTKADCFNLVNRIQSLGCTPDPSATSCTDAKDVTATC